MPTNSPDDASQYLDQHANSGDSDIDAPQLEAVEHVTNVGSELTDGGNERYRYYEQEEATQTTAEPDGRNGSGTAEVHHEVDGAGEGQETVMVEGTDEEERWPDAGDNFRSGISEDDQVDEESYLKDNFDYSTDNGDAPGQAAHHMNGFEIVTHSQHSNVDVVGGISEGWIVVDTSDVPKQGLLRLVLGKVSHQIPAVCLHSIHTELQLTSRKLSCVKQSIHVQKETLINAFFGVSAIARGLLQKNSTSLNDSVPAMVGMIDRLATLPTGPPVVALDCEGKDLGRHGTLAVVQLHDFRNDHTFIIDVVILGHAAFHTTASTAALTFGDILALSTIRKIMWDCRNDQDAIWAGFELVFDGIDDAQILELATRCAWDREKRLALRHAIPRHAGLDPATRQAWTEAKYKGMRLCQGPKGYGVWLERPMTPELKAYAKGDVCEMLSLYRYYTDQLSSNMRREAQSYTDSGLRIARSKGYNPNGYSNWRGPWPTVVDSDSHGSRSGD